ncbi:MAG: cell division protein ZapA [Lachnospiraceae bacterium]|nr:cell division protein ZapA [Lachnospiraceae bacterium]
MSSKNKTEVLIDGKIYTLSGYESEEYLQRVATYINNKIAEIKTAEGYHRLPSDLQGIMLNLNTADDYFKAKKQADSLEAQLAEKDKELYEIKHELISVQIKLETAEKTLTTLQDEASDDQKRIVQLEAQLETLRGQRNSKN